MIIIFIKIFHISLEQDHNNKKNYIYKDVFMHNKIMIILYYRHNYNINRCIIYYHLYNII